MRFWRSAGLRLPLEERAEEGEGGGDLGGNSEIRVWHREILMAFFWMMLDGYFSIIFLLWRFSPMGQVATSSRMEQADLERYFVRLFREGNAIEKFPLLQSRKAEKQRSREAEKQRSYCCTTYLRPIIFGNDIVFGCF
jgi:hypothetical protein